MERAEVGDDVFEEDPTVKQLEAMAAERMGKACGLFVASGTMANIVSQMTHCGRGDEMILGDQAHIFFYEQGGSAALGGIHPRTVPNEPDGKLSLQRLEAAIRTDNIHFPRTRLIVLENTHNRCYGSPLDAEYMHQVGEIARTHRLSVHVDGARIFNAAAALGVAANELVTDADSVSFCLSKGLAAPVGSLLCGSQEFIGEARRVRKVLGGGMRQAGVLAAAGIVALNEMVDRLEDDHHNARRLGEGLADMGGVMVRPENVRTNIVFFEVNRQGMTAAAFAEQLKSEGIRVLPTGTRQLRAVTHYHITPDDIDYTLKVFQKLIG
jgi:threonine aldolase